MNTVKCGDKVVVRSTGKGPGESGELHGVGIAIKVNIRNVVSISSG